MTRPILALLLSVVACGGQVADTGDPSGEGRRDARGDGGSSVPTVSLPPCEPGPLPSAREPGESCAWVDHEGRCYADKIDACACVCRALGGRSCLSSFPGGSGAMVPVDCY